MLLVFPFTYFFSFFCSLRFKVDKDTGRVTVSGALDRETVDTYYVSAEARDGGGYTAFTNLQINILDENDKSPVFRREEYFATVREDSLTFLREPVVVEVINLPTLFFFKIYLQPVPKVWNLFFFPYYLGVRYL